MSINLKAVTVCFGYQQITSLSSATKLTVPQSDSPTGPKQMQNRIVRHTLFANKLTQNSTFTLRSHRDMQQDGN